MQHICIYKYGLRKKYFVAPLPLGRILATPLLTLLDTIFGVHISFTREKGEAIKKHRVFVTENIQGDVWRACKCVKYNAELHSKLSTSCLKVSFTVGVLKSYVFFCTTLFPMQKQTNQAQR